MLLRKTFRHQLFAKGFFWGWDFNCLLLCQFAKLIGIYATHSLDAAVYGNDLG
jgi:hypothetical protein